MKKEDIAIFIESQSINRNGILLLDYTDTKKAVEMCEENKINVLGIDAFSLQGNKLVVSAGYSHTIDLEVPAGLKVELPKNTEIVISGSDKQLVGQFAAVIREIRKPEPYKGKGIAYEGEHIRRKEGKTAKK